MDTQITAFLSLTFSIAAFSCLQTATPRHVYELCREILIQGKQAPGGFIMAPGCGISATAPPVNVFAMTRAVYDIGWYR
jgi:uroporphyrinogen decarboxylase